MLLRGKLQIDAVNSNFENFKSSLYMKSMSMPLINLCVFPLKLTSEIAYEVLEMACYMQLTDVLPVFCRYVDTCLKLGLEKFSMEDIFKIEQLARSSLPTVSDRNLLDLVEEC